MQKKLIALAIAGLSSAAFAQSNVTVYGQVSAGLEFLNVSNANGVNGGSYNRVQDQTSRIGFKGAEDLGNGLKAVWQIESGLDLSGNREHVSTPGNTGVDGAVTNGGTSGFLGSRNTFLGLAGGFGTVIFGRHDTPYKLSGQKLNLFSGTTADYDAIVGEGVSRFDLRANNVLAYLTPNFSGFSGAVAYVANEAKGYAGNASSDLAGVSAFGREIGSASAWSVMGAYDNGPIYASLAYEKHQDFNTVATAGTVGAQNVPLYTGAANAAGVFGAGNLGKGNDEHAWKLSAAYTFAPNSLVGLLYEEIKAETYNANTGAATERKDKHWGLAGSFGLGNVVLKAQYLIAKDSKNQAGVKTDNGSKFYTLGADYNLSKRTAAFAQYARMSNDSAGTRNFLFGAGGGNAVQSTASGAATISAGQDVSVIGVGLRHSF